MAHEQLAEEKFKNVGAADAVSSYPAIIDNWQNFNPTLI